MHVHRGQTIVYHCPNVLVSKWKSLLFPSSYLSSYTVITVMTSQNHISKYSWKNILFNLSNSITLIVSHFIDFDQTIVYHCPNVLVSKRKSLLIPSSYLFSYTVMPVITTNNHISKCAWKNTLNNLSNSIRLISFYWDCPNHCLPLPKCTIK